MALVRTGIKGWTLHPTITGKPDFFFPKQRFACSWMGAFGTDARDAVTYLQLELRFGKIKLSETEYATKETSEF